MTYSKEINSQNKGGVEIQSYAHGIVIDLGYRMGNTPTLNRNGVVTVTDKNNKKCSLPNSEFHKITGYNAELIYKTNQSLHKFLTAKCPGLDLSDLASPANAKIKPIIKPKNLGAAPTRDTNLGVIEGKRAPKEKIDDDDIGTLIKSLDKASGSLSK